MPAPPDTDAEIIAPSFHLQRKIGGPASRVIDTGKVKKAEAALEKVVPPIQGEVAAMLKLVETEVRARTPGYVGRVWKLTHEIRGLAGTVKRVQLGQAANLLARYLEGATEDFAASADLVASIASVALMAARADGEDAMVKMLLSDTARAVVTQRRREGRSELD